MPSIIPRGRSFSIPRGQSFSIARGQIIVGLDAGQDVDAGTTVPVGRDRPTALTPGQDSDSGEPLSVARARTEPLSPAQDADQATVSVQRERTEPLVPGQDADRGGSVRFVVFAVNRGEDTVTDNNEQATYRAEFTITDAADSPIPLSGTGIQYLVSTQRAGDEELLTKTDADPRVTIEPNDRVGVVRVRLEADEVTWSGVVFEELRVTSPSFSVVPIQRSVTFAATETNP